MQIRNKPELTRATFYKQSVRKDSKRIDGILVSLMKTAESHPNASGQVAGLLDELVSTQKQCTLGDAARKDTLKDIKSRTNALQIALRKKNSAHNVPVEATNVVDRLVQDVANRTTQIDHLSLDAKAGIALVLGAGVGVGIETSSAGKRTLRLGVGITIDFSFGLSGAVQANHYSTVVDRNRNPILLVGEEASDVQWAFGVGWHDDDRHKSRLQGVSFGFLPASGEAVRRVISIPVAPLPRDLQPIKHALRISYGEHMLSDAALQVAEAKANSKESEKQTRREQKAAAKTSSPSFTERLFASVNKKPNIAASPSLVTFDSMRVPLLNEKDNSEKSVDFDEKALDYSAYHDDLKQSDLPNAPSADIPQRTRVTVTRLPAE